jgi:hypothetical protein
MKIIVEDRVSINATVCLGKKNKIINCLASCLVEYSLPVTVTEAWVHAPAELLNQRI